MTTKPPRPPKHLSASTRRWWSDVVANFEMEEHHLKILTGAGELWDRAQEAGATVKREGAFYVNRFGEPRVHPAVTVQRDALVGFSRMVRELGLDSAPAPEAPRPPRTGGRHAG